MMILEVRAAWGQYLVFVKLNTLLRSLLMGKGRSSEAREKRERKEQIVLTPVAVYTPVGLVRGGDAKDGQYPFMTLRLHF